MKITTHKDLEVYQIAMKCCMDIFDITREFPKSEIYSLTDQILRSSRSVCANIGEAFVRRKYVKSFISKLNEVIGEATETQIWIDVAYNCNYISESKYSSLYEEYNKLIAKLITMSNQVDKWSPKQL